MEDTRLPDSQDRKRCPTETCGEYAFRVPAGPNKLTDTFHCFKCSPHCQQIGHTRDGAIVSEAECERQHQHPKELDFAAMFPPAPSTDAEVAPEPVEKKSRKAK